jgi:broad specificity polyphosphatase/5'/3'-nucleotidase SurE
VVLSVNYPARNAGAGAGAKSVLTRAGRRDYPRAAETEWADGDVHWLYLFGEPDEIIPEADGSLGTDIGALRAGYVSVTPLSFAVELGDLSPGFQSFIALLSETFPLGHAMGKTQAEP